MLSYIEYIKEARDLRQPFIQAAVRGNNNKVKEFIKSGIDINMKDKDGRTALMNAALNSFLMTVMILLDAGADPNLQDKDGRTALMMTSTNKIFDKLFDAGADVNITDYVGNSIIMDRISEFRYFDKKTFLEKFIKNGLNLSIKNIQGINFYDKLKILKEEDLYGKNSFDDIIKYMDENYPQYKDEWEMKQNVNKYNL